MIEDTIARMIGNKMDSIQIAASLAEDGYEVTNYYLYHAIEDENKRRFSVFESPTGTCFTPLP